MSGASHLFNEPLYAPAVPDTNWHIVGSADANGDGSADLYWHHQTTGALAIWYMRGTELVSGEALSPGAVADTNWKVRTVADMDGDGQPDLIWQHVVTGHLAVWFMNGRQLRSGQSLGPGVVPDLNWTIVGAGDANRDGSVDLFWHHLGTGDIAVWFMRGQTLLSGDRLSPARVPDTNWRLRGIGDMDGNGSPDLLWQNVATLQSAVWFMNGRQLVSGQSIVGPALPGAAWHLVSPR
ncbi:MAG: VCBS repeat-containing protein [Acidobacteria bacterium]|nr:VCBS repeat-containing protein [Acidobacteriota bacterium]